MSPIDYYFLAFSRWNDFKGRSNRPEYWHFFWVNLVVSMLLGLVDSALTLISPGVAQVGNLYSLLVILPNVAVTVRRMHDIGKSPLLLLIYLVITAVPFWGLMYLVGFDAEALFGNPEGPYFSYAMVWLVLVSVLSLYFIYLFALKGDAGDNAYGPPSPHVNSPSRKAEQA
jgi:uncharacterized membrane protein YhaH (DUF805 family)